MHFNLYPYTDFHELNLDMILRMMKDLHKEWTDFEAVNKITNAGAWDITKQYQAWTVVSDNNVGYISLKPVPVGVDIHNIEYWGVIADYDILITDLSNRISMLEKFTEGYVTPEMFGADGDGVADDTSSVQTAIDSGKAVFLVNKYRITSTLKIPMDARITGRGYDSQILSEIDDGTPVLYCDSLSHVNLSSFVISGGDKDSIGVQLDNPYDSCSLTNIFFINMVNTSIKCGTAGNVSQGLLIDNCITWNSATNADAGTHNIYDFEKCNEFNITNSKLLYNGAARGSVENLIATNCIDMYISGCSFATTTAAALKFTGANSRYCRIIGNTYELVDGGTNSAIIELSGTVADGVQNFIIIEQPYYNCPARVYNENSAQNIIIGLSTAGGRRNLSINNKGGADAYNNLNLKSDGNELLSDAFGIQSGDSIHHTIKENTTGDLTFINHTTGNMITFGVHIELSRNGGGLKLKDANGRAYYVIVNTNGQLQVVPA